MIKVTCAVIRNEENEILIVQRGEGSDHPLQWEFPGGKINRDEAEEECIIREIREELSMDIVIVGRLPVVKYDYGHKKIELIPFICDTLDDLPFLSEHVDYKWINAGKFKSVDFSGADIIVANDYVKSARIDKKESVSDSHSESENVDDRELQSIVNRMMSMKEAEWIATSAIENPAIFKKLLEYSYSSDNKLAFRASWTLTKVCDKFPEIIYPFLSQMIEALGNLDNESTLRSFLRIISLSDMARVGLKHHGLLTHFCFTSLNSGFAAIAVKAYSMEILYRLTLIYPELATELAVSIRNIMDEGSAGIRARGIIILRKLNNP